MLISSIIIFSQGYLLLVKMLHLLKKKTRQDSSRLILLVKETILTSYTHGQEMEYQ